MRCREFGGWSIRLLATGMLMLVSSAVSAQTSSSTDDNSTGLQAGVIIDAEGVLRTKIFSDPDGQLMRDRINSAKASLDPKIVSYSKLRKVSLNRLEQAIRDHQGVLTDDMRFLAGLQRVRYVFYYPETKDIVLAGPAEGWVSNQAGRVVGISSKRPVVQLQDLVAALRAFPPEGKSTTQIGCSIDPTPEGLAAMQKFVKTIRLNGPPSDEQVNAIAEGVRNSLGLQNVSVQGVSPKTHFAQVLVEADYRMKLIGIGLEIPAVKFASYVDKVKMQEVSRNAMQRWYFMPDYQCVRESDDKYAMELVGDGVKLVGEDEVVLSSGQRKSAVGHNKASQAFTSGFTKKYPELAERSPIYAELRNLIDLSIAAAYIQEQNYYAQAEWKMELFGDEKEFAIETYQSPKTVETAVRALWKGNTLGTPVGGGVQILPAKAFASENLLSDDKGNVGKLREEIQLNLAKGQWWWD
jgi:hypothetical protein